MLRKLTVFNTIVEKPEIHQMNVIFKMLLFVLYILLHASCLSSFKFQLKQTATSSSKRALEQTMVNNYFIIALEMHPSILDTVVLLVTTIIINYYLKF